MEQIDTPSLTKNVAKASPAISGHKTNVPKPHQSLKQINVPSPTKNVALPPPMKASSSTKASPAVSGGCKVSTSCPIPQLIFSFQRKVPSPDPPTYPEVRPSILIVVFARLVKSTNFLVNHGSSSGSQRENTSAEQSPAEAEGWGSWGWLSSWFVTPVQATKKLMPNPSKGMNTDHTPPGCCLVGSNVTFPAKDVESLQNESQTRQAEVLNSSTCNFFCVVYFRVADVS